MSRKRAAKSPDDALYWRAAGEQLERVEADLARVVAHNLSGLTDTGGAVASYTTSQIVLGSAR